MPQNKRADPQNWAIRLAPWLLGLIALALLITLVVLALSIFGITPE